MKKLISVVLVLMMVFSLAACGKSTTTGGKDKKITVGVVQTNANESDWRTANTKSFNEADRKSVV